MDDLAEALVLECNIPATHRANAREALLRVLRGRDPPPLRDDEALRLEEASHRAEGRIFALIVRWVPRILECVRRAAPALPEEREEETVSLALQALVAHWALAHS